MGEVEVMVVVGERGFSFPLDLSLSMCFAFRYSLIGDSTIEPIASPTL